MINENGEKKELSREEATEALQAEILDALNEVNNLLPELGHSEAKRLLLAMLSYPLETQDFSDAKEALRKAYSASKRSKDAMIALGVEVTLENMIKQQFEAQEGENNE
jgi:hypothetical protein